MPGRRTVPGKAKPVRNNEHRIVTMSNAQIAIENTMRMLCLERILDFGVISVGTVGVEGELAGFTTELLRSELLN
jgi:hypothetical protein